MPANSRPVDARRLFFSHTAQAVEFVVAKVGPGELLDVCGEPLDEGALRKEAEDFERRMVAAGVAPGSKEAIAMF